MKRLLFALSLSATLFALTGCGSEPPATGDAPAESAGSIENGPSRVVARFLEAVRRGEDSQAQSMLTELAQQNGAHYLSPVGSDTARFEVGATVLSEDNLARVPSGWTDVNHEGTPHTDQITCVLRQEEGQWLILSMITSVEEGGVIELNFENPEAMRQAAQFAPTVPHQADRTEDPFQRINRQ